MLALTLTRQADWSIVRAVKRCDLCDGTDFENIADRDRRGRPLPTCLCLRCGLVCHARIPTDTELDRYYAHEYRRDYHGEFTPSDRRVWRAWRNGQRLLAQLSPWIERGEQVCEIGAGIGCTVKAFELAGYRTRGIEPGAGFQQFARNCLRADVTCRRLFDLPPTPQYDAVLLVHVIEHFRSPRQALEHIHRMLRPGGRLYVECPNLAAPFARRSRLFHYAHIHNFTPTTLAMLAQRCGFHVERQFSSPRDPNLQLLLTQVDLPRLRIDPDSVAQTRAALHRAGSLAYHLRWNYLWPRVRKLAAYLREHWTARHEVRQLLARCAAIRENTTRQDRAA